MSLPVPVTGIDVCPKCKGQRVIEGLPTTPPRRDDKRSSMLMWDHFELMYHWCDLCGGEGTASAAMERILIK